MRTADHILIPLLNGQHALAQIARVDGDRALLLVTERLTSPSATVRAIEPSDVLAGLCVLLSDLPTDMWPVVGYDAVPRIAAFQSAVLSDLAPRDPTHIEAFANALHGLYPWDGFPDPAYFTGMLRNADTLPDRARLSADFPKPD